MSKTTQEQHPYYPWVPPFKYNLDGQWIEDSKGERVLDMRGWGFLTGTGGCNLLETQAARIQDEIGKRVTALMNRDAEAATDRLESSQTRTVPLAIRMSDGTLVPVEVLKSDCVEGYQFCVVTLERSEQYRHGARIFCNESDLVKDARI